MSGSWRRIPSSRSTVLRACGCVGVGWLSVSSPALAIPVIRVTAVGTCPSQRELTQAVAAKGWPQTPVRGAARAVPDYDIVSRADPTGATLELQRSGGPTLFARRFASDDCRALADAMVVVVEAYFVDVGEPGLAQTPEQTVSDRTGAVLPGAAIAPTAETATTTPSDGATTGAPTGTPSTTALAPNQGLTSNSAPTPTRARDATSATKGVRPIVGTVSPPHGTMSTRPIDARTAPNAPIPTKTEESSSFIARMRGFVGVGATLALPRNHAIRLVTPSIELGAGVVFAAIPLSADVLLGSGLRSTAGESPNRIERWANHALIRAGWVLTKQPELRPWLGAGLQVASLRAIDLPHAETRTSLSSLVGVGLEASTALASNWSARADLGCMLRGTREHYQVSPTESLGDGPRVICSATLGVSFGKSR